MKIRSAIFVLTLLVSAAAQAAGEGKDVASKAQAIIELKCTKCHSDAQIEAAYRAGKDMGVIVKEMEKRGAKLTSNEKEVLGIFWKEKAPAR